MKFNQQVDKRAILILLGCYCNNPRLVKDENLATVEADYPENFHKLIWGAIENLVKKGKLEEITPMLLDTEMSQFEMAYSIWNNNNGWEYIQTAKEEALNEYRNVGRYRDEVRKYSLIRNAIEELKLDVSFIYNEADDVIMQEFSKMTSKDVLKEINSKFTKFKSKWKHGNEENHSFHASEGIKDRLEEHKKQINTYGYPFQSGYLTTVYRGMRPQKFIIRSSISGGGKITKR